MDDTTLADHQTDVAMMRELFIDETISATLTDSTEAVTVFGVKSFSISKTVEDRNWVCDLSLEVLAAASTIT